MSGTISRNLKRCLLICVICALYLLPHSAVMPAAFAAYPLQTSYDCTNASGIEARDCDLLVLFYSETNGANWTNNTGWLQTDTPCSWFGVSCVDGRVTVLDLPENQLTGSIPNQLGLLSNLTNLHLYRNRLTGSIPVGVILLSDLTELNLSRNQLSGSIPTVLGDLSNLTRLELGGNQLTGSIPTHLAALTNLEEIHLYSNQLSGAIPSELGRLSNLTTLHLTDNELTGVIPSELGQLSNLTSLWLESNQLSGAIPAELGDLSNLSRFIVSSNQLGGVIPESLACAPNWLNLGADFGIDYNRLVAENAQAAVCMDGKSSSWQQTQTVPPTNLQVSITSPTSVHLKWDEVLFTDQDKGGHFEVGLSVDEGTEFNIAERTANKSVNEISITNLETGTAYTFAVRTFTPAHGGASAAESWDDQGNDLTSDYGEGIRIVMPPTAASATPSAVPEIPTNTSTPSRTSTPQQETPTATLTLQPTPTTSSTSLGVIGGASDNVLLPAVVYADAPTPTATPTPLPEPAWRYVGDGPQEVYSLAINGNTLFATDRSGENGGLYQRSISGCDLGTTFTKNSWITTSALGIEFRGSLGLLAAFRDGIFYSNDSGMSWTKSTGADGEVYSVAFVDSTGLASIAESVYESEDGGVTWDSIADIDQPINVIDRISTSLWLGTDGAGVLELTIGSNVLTPRAEGLSTTESLQVWDIVGLDTLYIATYDGVFYGNGFSPWQRLGDNLAGVEVRALEIVGETLYAATRPLGGDGSGGGVYTISISNPTTWTLVTIGHDESATWYVRDLHYDGTHCNGLLAATDEGVWILR